MIHMKTIIATVTLLAIMFGYEGCGYISGVGINYDPNTGAIGGSVTFPAGRDYKQVVKPKTRKGKTNAFK